MLNNLQDSLALPFHQVSILTSSPPPSDSLSFSDSCSINISHLRISASRPSTCLWPEATVSLNLLSRFQQAVSRTNLRPSWAKSTVSLSAVASDAVSCLWKSCRLACRDCMWIWVSMRDSSRLCRAFLICCSQTGLIYLSGMTVELFVLERLTLVGGGSTRLSLSIKNVAILGAGLTL